jgi:2-isopropylmalate synthase
MRRLHRLEPAAPVRRRLEHRRAAAADGGGDCLRRARGPAGALRHRGHHPRRPGDAAPALFDRDPTPAGAAAVVRFVAGVVEECGGGVGIDWHGHRDRDFAVINSLAALEAGATRLHGAAIGIGERVGNTPMDMLLVNLVLLGYIERDLSSLVSYCETVSQATGVPIPANYPVVGRDAFRTATGVHAAAVIKAFRKRDAALVDAVYSGVPASLVGRDQEIDVGPMSGKSNVVFWLEKRGIAATDDVVERIFARAKASATVLEEKEIRDLLRQ